MYERPKPSGALTLSSPLGAARLLDTRRSSSSSASPSGSGHDSPASRARCTYFATVLRAREHIEAHLDDTFELADLERACDRDRWQLSRDFRSVLGASPYRYWIHRRLDRARALIRAGHSLADVASACGFADQSHFTRHFKKTYGVTPKVWCRHEGTASP